jgi:transcriptional regulator with XRE-family HTH domain
MCKMTGRSLRLLRKRLGLSVAKAAALIHVAPRTWVRWESGETPVPDTAAHLFHLVNGLEWPLTKKARSE